MRLAHRLGRAVVVSPDCMSLVDLAERSGGRFGPSLRDVYDDWPDFKLWVGEQGDALFVASDDLRPEELGAPSPEPRQVFAVGLNYRDHADEDGYDYPDTPLIFTKYVTSFAGPCEDLVLPSESVDWEVELVVVIGRYAQRVPADRAWAYVAGLTIGQDYSERKVQMDGPVPQFSLAKSYPGFSPQGPWLVTPDELTDPVDLELTCTINGSVVQHGRTGRMIFGVASLVEHLSSTTPLLPGDVIFTGTPSGVGAAQVPPCYLKAGDVVESSIEGLGSIRQRCVGGVRQ